MALPVQAAGVGWRPNQTMYCSDGEFDWDSGQSLYDFVIQTRAPDDFIVSYLGIPHPSFETRDFFHIWMKMRGQFSSAFAQKERTRVYALQFNLENEPPRTGTLTIAADDTYKFSMTPPLDRDTTKSGLCSETKSPLPSWPSQPFPKEMTFPFSNRIIVESNAHDILTAGEPKRTDVSNENSTGRSKDISSMFTLLPH